MNLPLPGVWAATVPAMADQLRPDIADARDRAHHRVGGKKELAGLEARLQDGELVGAVAMAEYEGAYGLLTVTDRRLLFAKDGMMNKKAWSLPLGKVISAEWSKEGVGGGTIVVQTAGAPARFGRVLESDGAPIVDRLQQL